MTPHWSCLNLGDAMLATDVLEKLKQCFTAQYAADVACGNMALFVRHESEGQLHCDLIVYFPPGTETLAAQFNAGPCAPPAAGDLGLLAGEQRAWSRWFPHHEAKDS